MRASRKGIAIILLFFVAIPFMADAVLAVIFSSEGANGKLTEIISIHYLTAIPYYAVYLVVAFTVLHLIRLRKRSKNK